MAILSYPYLFLFLPAAVLLVRATASRAAMRTPALVLTGIAYYALSAGIPQLALLLVMTLVIFAGVRASTASGDGSRQRLGLVAVALALAVLAAFKLATVLRLGPLGGVLPLGISFYTFNLVSYGLDVRRGRTAKSVRKSPLANRRLAHQQAPTMPAHSRISLSSRESAFSCGLTTTPTA